MLVSELVARLDEHRQRVGNVGVTSLLSSDWEDFEGPVIGVWTERGPIGSRLADPERPATVSDLIARLSEEQQSAGGVDVKLCVTGKGPYGGGLGPITEVSSLRWTTQLIGGATTTTTAITVSGPIER